MTIYDIQNKFPSNIQSTDFPAIISTEQEYNPNTGIDRYDLSYRGRLRFVRQELRAQFEWEPSIFVQKKSCNKG